MPETNRLPSRIDFAEMSSVHPLMTDGTMT
jgi:hypothetical protein